MLIYNHQNYIVEAIKSVINQQYNFDIELFLADDCS
jgi:glycosyltransferase involved in cell wall biosynthesis